MQPVLAAITAMIQLPMSAGTYDAGVAPSYPSQDQYRPNMEGLILHGDSSTGNASGLCAKLPDLGVCRSLAERAKDAPSVLNAVSVVCDGLRDDREDLQTALNLASTWQGTVRL